ncbi:MAG: ADP-forming succinate--CoA ligase subunit beta [Candidatus Omnitrophica bacterium]|nr:ADP-forming succinate--CoA ligase subunit beta [Candidatus Omnitrophota bacterium]
MKIHEYQAVELFRHAGLPVCDGQVAQDANQALKIAESIGFPVVLKAQVLVGGRGKAGGVKLVHSASELPQVFNQIKNLTIKGYAVERILVAKVVNIKKEYYAAVTIDNIKGDIVIIASNEGGVDIEETAKQHPEKILKYYLEGAKTIDPARWGEFIRSLFPDQKYHQEATAIFEKLLKFFISFDCSLAEINPLVIDDNGKLIAADAKVLFDDNALYRHEQLQSMRDFKYDDQDEVDAKTMGLSFVKLEGNVGCIVNGAGLAMGTMDAIKLLGGQPANFLDVGGSSNPEKVLNALKLILKNKGIKVILINIFGGITRCDDIANGILTAKKQIELPVPLVVRLTGTNEDLAKEILSKAGVTTYKSMREAVTKAVSLAK